MSATTIRLSDALKAHIPKSAEAADTMPHSCILEADAKKAEQSERHSEFHAEAERRWSEFLQTGMSIPWNEMRRHLTDHAKGKAATPPIVRKIGREARLKPMG